MTSPVMYQFEQSISTITLDDGKVNAMSPTMLSALNAALDQAERDAGVVVIQGREGIFSGGFDFAPGDADAKDLAKVGYAKGVPMGGDLSEAPDGKAPSFLVRATKDPVEGNLDRIQIVKGWLDKDGKSHEKVFNVAVSDDRQIKNNKVKPIGNTVDLKTASYTNTIGDAELATVWTDPEFDPSARAFYYVRVLQIPTPRHSLYDAVALGIDPKETARPATIQERAYSSPIWYTP